MSSFLSMEGVSWVVKELLGHFQFPETVFTRNWLLQVGKVIQMHEPSFTHKPSYNALSLPRSKRQAIKVKTEKYTAPSSSICEQRKPGRWSRDAWIWY